MVSLHMYGGSIAMVVVSVERYALIVGLKHQQYGYIMIQVALKCSHDQ